mgnify:FL=1
MKENNENSIFRIILRYLYIIFYLVLVFYNSIEFSTFDICIMLVFLINNQIRFFAITNKKISFLSIVLECFMGIYLYKLVPNYGQIIFIPAAIDVIYRFEKYMSLLYLSFITFYIVFTNSFEQLAFLLIEIIPIVLLGQDVRGEVSKKRTAQDLYDELRMKDEALRIANEELKDYAATLEEVTLLRERNRISREIHDNVGHALSAIRIQLGAIEVIAKKDSEKASLMASNLSKFTEKSLNDVRMVVRDMKPREFYEYEGIIAISEMIKNFEKMTGISVKLAVSKKVWKMNSDEVMTIYRITQEFLSNSLRHGKSTEVKIFMNFLEDCLRVQYKNNGEGASHIKEGTGLSGIRERLSVYGGSMKYYTDKDNGFELIINMPKGKLSIDEV